MRIITGTKKNHKIVTPKGQVTRPALAKVREAIFSSLGDIQDKIVMDVFAGCGSLGLEALSRGAKSCSFVENNSAALSSIITNLESMGFEDQAHVFKRNMPNGLRNINLEQTPDIIFCDPPYDKNLINRTLTGLLDNGFVSPKTIIIIEHTDREPPNIKELTLVKQKKYGQTLISYLKVST